LKELSVKETNNQVVVEILAPVGPKIRSGKTGDLKEDDEENPDEENELLSAITEKKLKEGSMKLFDSNYYVDGLQRREITIEGTREEE
jgi:hypothetical protein